MKVVVTGGAGFIGANVCRQLVAAGHEVVAFDDLSTGLAANLVGVDAALVEGSILDAGALDDVLAGAGAVVHLGARPSVPARSPTPWPATGSTPPAPWRCSKPCAGPATPRCCLLYTSDAADE